MKANERRALTRILIDLIKADKVIDSREMELYAELKQQFGITREDEGEAFMLTLGEAISTICALPQAEVRDYLGTFEKMTLSDSFCAREEALLMLALRYCLDPHMPQSDVLSVEVDDVWFDDRQVLYVESYFDEEVNAAVAGSLRQIQRELKLCGLDFVYLPEVVNHYLTTPAPLMEDVAMLLSPTLSQSGVRDLLSQLKNISTDKFCIEQLHHKLGFEELAQTDPALLMRIGQTRVGDRVVTNFLRISLDTDPLREVERLTDLFLSACSNDRVVISHKRDAEGSFLYNGFYRQLFEIILLKRAVTTKLRVDFRNMTLVFPGIDAVLSGLHRKEKTMYVLMIFESQKGGINFTPPRGGADAHRYERRMEQVKRRFARIYRAFEGTTERVPDITRQDIRNPILANIKREVMRHESNIYKPERFVVQRDRDGYYAIPAISEAFECVLPGSDEACDIFATPLFAELAAIK